MAKQKPKQQPKEFDIHRTLPAHHRRAAHRQAAHAPRATAPTMEGVVYPEEAVKKKRRFTWKRLFASIIIGCLLFVLFIAAWDARNFSRASSKMFGSGNLMQLVTPTSLKGSDQGRVNVLVVGYSVDDPGHQGATLTDSIMLLSMSTTNHTGYMLSIPRDLYVRIPGFGAGKINEAYHDGGMPLLEQIVEKDFATHIDYYALVDYSAVRDSVNALGGVDVTINSPDGKLYDPNKDYATGGPLVDLSNGLNHLNGEQALDLTRARGDPSQFGDPIGFEKSDFQRTADQRLVFSALKDKLNWKLILDPRKNGEVFDAVAGNVKTDVQLSEVRPLYQLFTGIPTPQMQSISLNDFNGKNLLASTAYEGSTLSPAAGINNYSAIQAVLDQLNAQ
jgi:LCP family protein required for cell wall assembly